MKDEDKNEWIEQYIQGNLNGQKLEAFEKQLAADSNLQKEVALEKSIIKNLKRAGRNDWTMKLESFHQEIIAEDLPASSQENRFTISASSKKAWYSGPYFMAAAATVLLLLVATVLFFSLRASSPEKLFVAYYTPYSSIEQTKRGSNENLTERKKAFEAYVAGKYVESISLFQSVLIKGQDESVLFYLGNAYLSADRPQEAENTFKSYLATYQEFEAEAEWYLSLSYLKQKKTQEAKQLLTAISAKNNEYSDKAKDLLSKLD
jgi:tetratricopeptide (TPR) repeat protein